MLNFKTETYNDNIKQLIVETSYCSKCDSKFIKIRKKYDSANTTNVHSNIDFDATECTICNNHRYDVADLDKDAKELAKLVKDTSIDNKSTQLRVKADNKQINNLWSLLYAIGKYGYNKYNVFQFITSKYAIQCNRCGYIKITDDNNLESASKSVCNKCRYKLSVEANKDYEYVQKEIASDIKKCIDYMQKQKDKAEQVQDNQEVEQKDASSFTKMKQRFKKHNPNMDLMAAYTEDDLQKSLICCSLCGTPSEVSTHRMKELKNFECSGCKAQINNPNYLGLYRRDLTNTTKNGLVCIGQDGDKVTLRCKYCGTRHTNRDKVKFLMGKIGCNKKPSCSSVEVLCPECFYGVTIRNKDIFSASVEDITCPKCNENIYYEAKNEIISTDAAIEINEGLRYFSSQTKKPVKYDSGIARTAEPLYRGTDGIDYYNCRCVVHNQSCILNEDELQHEHHKYCNNIHSLFIDELKFKNLKLNREASITERQEIKNN